MYLLMPPSTCFDLNTPQSNLTSDHLFHVDSQLWFRPKCFHFTLLHPVLTLWVQLKVKRPYDLSKNQAHFGVSEVLGS